MRLLSATAIRDRLAARLSLPGPGPRDVPARQRTLEATVAWSYELLPADQQALACALAVFDGGFDLEQATAVAGPRPDGQDRLDDLLALADQSLIQPMPAPTGRIRFRMLRTIASYALARLEGSGRETEVRRRHAEAFLDLLSAAVPHLNTSRHAAWIDRVAPDQGNLRTAIRWAIDAAEGGLALRLTGVLWRFWHAYGMVAEGRALAERALAMPEAPTSGVARAWAEAAAGNLAYWQADHVMARAHYERQIAVAEAASDEVGLADGWFNLAHVPILSGEPLEVQRHFVEQAIARFRDLGDERGMARADSGLAMLAMAAGRTDEAYALLTEDRATFERLDDRQYHAITSATLGWAAFMRGDMPEAIRCSVEALVETHAMRDLGTTTISLHVGVLIATMLARPRDAARLWGAFEALCERYGVRPPAGLERFIGAIDPLAQARAQLSPEAFAGAVEDGRRMDLDAAVAIIVELGDMADAAGTAPPG
jgi:tetratricopeptide (TPR) repeat protein